MSSCIVRGYKPTYNGGPSPCRFFGIHKICDNVPKSVISGLRLFLTIHFRGIEWMFSLHNVNAGLVKPQIVDRMGTFVYVRLTILKQPMLPFAGSPCGPFVCGFTGPPHHSLRGKEHQRHFIPIQIQRLKGSG